MEILTFIFSSFWIWFGTAILVSIIIQGIVKLVRKYNCQEIKKLKKELKKEKIKNKEVQ